MKFIKKIMALSLIASLLPGIPAKAGEGYAMVEFGISNNPNRFAVLLLPNCPRSLLQTANRQAFRLDRFPKRAELR